MIKVRGRNVTLTGEDAEAVRKVADALGLSNDEAFNKILMDCVERHKNDKPAKKRKKK